MVLSAIKFYNQPIPPDLPILQKMHSFLHGEKFNINKYSSGWIEDRYEYNASTLKNYFFYDLEYFEFSNNETRFHFIVKPINKFVIAKYKDGDTVHFANLEVENEDDPFPNPVVKKTFFGFADGVYPLLRKEIEVDSSHMIIADLYFPSLNRAAGDIIFSTNFKNMSDYETLFYLSGSSYPKGTPIWGILFVLGFFVFIIGIKASHSGRLRKEMQKELSKFDKSKSYILRNIEGDSSYKDLSSDKKLRYDSAVSYLEKAQNIILDFYKYQPFRAGDAFAVFFKLTVISGLTVLFAILVYTGLIHVFPDLQEHTRIFIEVVDFPTNIVEDRIHNLEREKSKLTVVLFTLLALGTLAILLNYALGVWNAHRVVRLDVGLRLAKYRENIATRIDKKTKLLDDKFLEIDNKLNAVEIVLAKTDSEFAFISDSLKSNLYKLYKQTLREIKKDSVKSGRTIKKDIKHHYKQKG
ncbi:MAG: hypothetical protein IEMM0007_1295 [bacterium]|nr:MAG: hypothetical protein IEMM0007_1295 [bacterium]